MIQVGRGRRQILCPRM